MTHFNVDDFALPTLAAVPIQMGLAVDFDEQGVAEKQKKWAAASGFVVETSYKRKFLITNRHNVTGVDQETGASLSSSTTGPEYLAVLAPVRGKSTERASLAAGAQSYVKLVFSLYDDDGHPVWYEHEHATAGIDVVAIALPEFKSEKTGRVREWEFSGYPYGSWGSKNLFSAPRPCIYSGQSMFVVGYPNDLHFGSGLLPLWSHATLASDASQLRNHEIFFIDSSTSQGHSGSAVVFHQVHGTILVEDNNKNVTEVHLREPMTQLMGIYSGRIKSVKGPTTFGRVWHHRILENTVPLSNQGSHRAQRPQTAPPVLALPQEAKYHQNGVYKLPVERVLLPNSSPTQYPTQEESQTNINKIRKRIAARKAKNKKSSE